MANCTPEQSVFINFEGSESVILSSVAGSGKTFSAVGRLNKLLNDGVDPSRIIFFSFTNDAVEELKTRINANVRIATIHSYCTSQLGKMGKFKPISTFYEFAAWYKEKYKPKPYENIKKKMEFQKVIDRFYEDGAQISSGISAYKMQNYDGVRCAKPKFYDEYKAFLNETKSRDFCDMLIETERLSKNPQYSHYFENTYDYVLIDEYQDTSTIQLKILLVINAKQYYLIGDPNQSIYGFSGANCEAIEALLKQHRPVKEFTLTMNFRSHRKIVEHANNFSDLKAVPFSEQDGLVEKIMITEDQMYEMMTDGRPLTILVRTNAVIKEIEKECLRKKYKMKYFNFLTAQDIEYIQEGKINNSIKKKLEAVAPYHGNPNNLIKFIEENRYSNVFVTSIHKSKGREYPRVIVINSFSPDQMEDIPEYLSDYSFINESGEIDVEARNVHYVASTRPKEELYYLMYEL